MRLKAVLIPALLIALLICVASGEEYTADYWFDKANESYSNKFYDTALQQIELSLDLNQTNDRAWNLKGRILIELQEYDNAVLCFNEAFELNSSYSMPLNNIGVALSNLGRNDEAIEYYDKAIQIDPLNVLAWVGKGHCLMILGEYDDAIKSCDEAIRLHPDSVAAWMIKGFTLQSMGKYDEASVAFTTAKQLENLTQKTKSYTLDMMVTLTYPEDWITETGSDSLTRSSWFYAMNTERTAVVDVEINRGLYPLIELEFEAMKLADWVPHADSNYSDQAIPIYIDGHPACHYLREYSNGQKVTIDVITYRESDICIGVVGSAFPIEYNQIETIMNSARYSVQSKGLSVYSMEPPDPYYDHPETTNVGVVTTESIAETLPKWLGRKYVRDNFDCSEISAYAEHWLEAHGINTKIVANTQIRHAWLICQLESGEWVPVEPQDGENCVITDPFSSYFVYDVILDDIYEAMSVSQFEWDWWNS